MLLFGRAVRPPGWSGFLTPVFNPFLYLFFSQAAKGRDSKNTLSFFIFTDQSRFPLAYRLIV